MRDVLVYVDDGSSFEVLLRELGRELDHSRARLFPVMAEDLVEGIHSEGGTLVMPGGADLPYCAKLNGAGNRRIREFVERGGAYLGICAGAYYACRSLTFHGGRPDEISGSRELALVDAHAVGSLGELGPFYDLTVRSASVAAIAWEELGLFRGFYHGGPRFELGPAGAEVFARFPDAGNAPAGIECALGDGRVVLVAAHLEVSPAALALSLAHLTDGAAYGHLTEMLQAGDKLRRRAFRDLLRRARLPLKSDRHRGTEGLRVG